MNGFCPLLVSTSFCCFPSTLTHILPQWYHPKNPYNINNLFILETFRFSISASECSWDDWAEQNNLFRVGNTEDLDSRFRQTILTVLLFISYLNPSLSDISHLHFLFGFCLFSVYFLDGWMILSVDKCKI